MIAEVLGSLSDEGNKEDDLLKQEECQLSEEQLKL